MFSTGNSSSSLSSKYNSPSLNSSTRISSSLSNICLLQSTVIFESSFSLNLFHLILSFFFKLRFIKKNKNHVFGMVILLVLFWPLMSTGSFLKNWNMIFTCYLIGVTFGINSSKFKNPIT